ncbi:unnamed protein product [Amoebophrya sp. A25]|nr:unnamed protein product [Amoebophrya sp. A25]|eukprot:GSA25T00026098001.1
MFDTTSSTSPIPEPDLAAPVPAGDIVVEDVDTEDSIDMSVPISQARQPAELDGEIHGKALPTRATELRLLSDDEEELAAMHNVVRRGASKSRSREVARLPSMREMEMQGGGSETESQTTKEPHEERFASLNLLYHTSVNQLVGVSDRRDRENRLITALKRSLRCEPPVAQVWLWQKVSQHVKSNSARKRVNHQLAALLTE